MIAMSDTVTIDDHEWKATDKTFSDDVLIRVRLAFGPSMYAVFDDGEKVSPDYGPMDDSTCISWAEGYVVGKNNE